MSSASAVMKKIANEDVKFVDLRFTDTLGKEQHVTIPASQIDVDFFEVGKAFDGSSIRGWKRINHSDMILIPDPATANIDPFFIDKTLILVCDVVDPSTKQPYARDPRALAKRAENYLKETGIADTCYFGPEPEFFIFDDVRWRVDINSAFYSVDSCEAVWNSGKDLLEGNLGHRPGIKGGYFPVPPVDSSQDIRSAICLTLEQMGLVVEAHHHEVATGNQNEVSTRFSNLLNKADQMQIIKYVVHNVAHQFGQTATFMPKPIVGDNGSGMHCHQSLAKKGVNIFTGQAYAGLSEIALYYIGGIIKHARALNAFTNPATNSYRRLVPGFEAPTMLAYSACNRSAAIRIPHTPEKARRIEVRFPDGLANPYLAFSAMMMAGLDGIQNRIHPGEPLEKDLYELTKEESSQIPTICESLSQALTALREDHAFLLRGDVFTEELIEGFIELKQAEVVRVHALTHPVEFEMYYSG